MGLTQMFENVKRRFDDSDVDSPLDFKYIKQLSFVLSTIGSWPHEQFGRNRLNAVLSKYNLFLACLAVCLTSLAMTYLWYYRHEMTFFDMGHIILTICLDVLYWIFSQIHIISGMLTFYVSCQLYCGLALFNFQSLYENYSEGMFGDNRPANSTFKQAVYYYSPFEEVYTTLTGFWMIFIFNIHNSYNVMCAVCGCDLLLSLIVLQVWGHLKILSHNLTSFPPPAGRNGMYSAEENVRIRQLLKENIDHHNLIIKFVDQCSNAFSEYLFMFYFLLQIISCILLLELSSLKPNAIVKYGTLTVAMYQQLIQVSILFEMLNTKSEQLIDSVYEVPWEHMDTSNRRTVMFLLHKVQTPVSLKAAKVVPVGVQTMFTVLKTTFSYYMMLITVAKEK